MTSCGQVTTQPAHPVHSPVVITSAYSSFHCAVQRAGGGAAASAPTVAVDIVIFAMYRQARCRGRIGDLDDDARSGVQHDEAMEMATGMRPWS